MLTKLICEFQLSISRDNKVTAAKDHGKKFRSKLAASVSVIVHYLTRSPWSNVVNSRYC